MVGWHYQLNGHDFEQIPGDSERQGSLACCSPRGYKFPDHIDAAILWAMLSELGLSRKGLLTLNRSPSVTVCSNRFIH